MIPPAYRQNGRQRERGLPEGTQDDCCDDHGRRPRVAVLGTLLTADVVTTVVFDGGVPGAFAPGAAWAQMGTIGVAATTEIAGRLGVQRQTSCSWTRRYRAARTRPKAAAAHLGVRPARGRIDRGPGVLGHRPQDGVARAGRPGPPDEAGRQRLHGRPHRGRGRCASSWPAGWASIPPSSTRSSRTAPWTPDRRR